MSNTQHAFRNVLHAEFKRSKVELRNAAARALEEFEGLDISASQLALTPAVLPRKTAVRVARACELVVRASHAAALEACASVERLIQFVGLRDAEPELLQYDRLVSPSDWRLIARPDIALTGETVAVFETNATPCIALFPEVELIDRIYRDVPGIWNIVRALTPVDTSAAFASTVKRLWGGAEEKLTALVEWRSDYLDAPFLYEYMAAALEQHGVQAIVACVEDLEVDGDRVLYKGEGIDAVYRFFDAPEASDPPAKHLQHSRLLWAIHGGRIELIGHIGQRLLVAKSLLALVSEAAVGGELARRARRFVPWTRVLADNRTTYRGQEVALLHFVERHRERLVLKASLGRGGSGTTVGRDATEVEWRTSIETAVASAEDWVVQEWVETPPEELAFIVDGELEFRRCNVDYGLFLFGGAFAGGVRRNTTPRAPRLTHITSGAGVGQIRLR